MSDHDPLCPQQPRDDGTTLTMLDGKPIYCLCDLIAKVRDDMLAKAIAAVEWLHDHEAPYDAHKDALWNAMTALRALQEKP
jgi:hypothetical protein